MPTRVEVCPADELPPGERTVVEVDGLPHSVGVFNVDGEYHALANVCPHHLAPLCEGTITGEMTSEGVGDYRLIRDGEVIRCPWHGWKFDIADGRSVTNPHRLRTRTYETAVETRSAGEAGTEAPDGAEGEGGSETEIDEYGTALKGDEPPVDSYEVDVEDAIVVLYV
jgi:nitrite reductase/ring-hydroxylating ferredoxin subunit